ncbi:hypothetical protein 2 [Beihai picorna-like virus 113]|uniref:hypothetical protein 2 n=1 Tax=Beihai picorna-like virus 113 TaxID=1922542 RepID=UPI00090994A9|nr:hypothetical protein 2 [Beihai picorna-like virus 113]APG78871.1 hypothetical protein 2 [Beihai picorna-like virus 113]
MSSTKTNPPTGVIDDNATLENFSKEVVGEKRLAAKPASTIPAVRGPYSSSKMMTPDGLVDVYSFSAIPSKPLIDPSKVNTATNPLYHHWEHYRTQSITATYLQRFEFSQQDHSTLNKICSFYRYNTGGMIVKLKLQTTELEGVELAALSLSKHLAHKGEDVGGIPTLKWVPSEQPVIYFHIPQDAEYNYNPELQLPSLILACVRFAQVKGMLDPQLQMWISPAPEVRHHFRVDVPKEVDFDYLKTIIEPEWFTEDNKCTLTYHPSSGATYSQPFFSLVAADSGATIKDSLEQSVCEMLTDYSYEGDTTLTNEQKFTIHCITKPMTPIHVHVIKIGHVAAELGYPSFRRTKMQVGEFQTPSDQVGPAFTGLNSWVALTKFALNSSVDVKYIDITPKMLSQLLQGRLLSSRLFFNGTLHCRVSTKVVLTNYQAYLVILPPGARLSTDNDTAASQALHLRPIDMDSSHQSKTFPIMNMTPKNFVTYEESFATLAIVFDNKAFRLNMTSTNPEMLIELNLSSFRGHVQGAKSSDWGKAFQPARKQAAVAAEAGELALGEIVEEVGLDEGLGSLTGSTSTLVGEEVSPKGAGLGDHILGNLTDDVMSGVDSKVSSVFNPGYHKPNEGAIDKDFSGLEQRLDTDLEMLDSSIQIQGQKTLKALGAIDKTLAAGFGQQASVGGSVICEDDTWHMLEVATISKGETKLVDLSPFAAEDSLAPMAGYMNHHATWFSGVPGVGIKILAAAGLATAEVFTTPLTNDALIKSNAKYYAKTYVSGQSMQKIPTNWFLPQQRADATAVRDSGRVVISAPGGDITVLIYKNFSQKYVLASGVRSEFEK